MNVPTKLDQRGSNFPKSPLAARNNNFMHTYKTRVHKIEFRKSAHELREKVQKIKKKQNVL